LPQRRQPRGQAKSLLVEGQHDKAPALNLLGGERSARRFQVERNHLLPCIDGYYAEMHPAP